MPFRARGTHPRVAYTRLLRIRAQREERFNNFASPSLRRYVSLLRGYVQHCREMADNILRGNHCTKYF